jgi:circadian clock protein KaiC
MEGSPSTGKTTIALQFLLEGAKVGETGLYITKSKTEQAARGCGLTWVTSETTFT